jgi:5-methyltetrahydropteroyltriglutamate--homocysteine methyltransferase
LFPRLKARRLLLEYDDYRSGSFDALADIPDDKFVVLGLISTKTSRLESMEELRNRVTAASRYFPMTQLGVSPQCGFASSVIGNPLSAHEQKRKLDLVVRTAREVWG